MNAGLFRRWIGRRTVPARTPGELDAMEQSGSIVAAALCAARKAAQLGSSTADIDAVAESVIREAGALPSFLGYHGFPGSVCVSINAEIVHGIPSADRLLANSDLVSIDCGAILDGWHGDSAITFGVGEISEDAHALNTATQAILEAGIRAMVPGARLSDISFALECAAMDQENVWSRGFGIVDGYGGHGIGRELHEPPYLANAGRPGRGPTLRVGSVLAIEPMMTLGSEETYTLEDDWTVVSEDGSLASHWEHTVAVTDSGPRILTQLK